MKTGKIGVIMPIICDELDCEFLQGIHESAKKLGYDVIVFTNSSNIQRDMFTSDFSKAEFNIYRLIACTELDGIIFAAGKFNHDGVVDSITEIILSSSIPCVVTEMEHEHFPFIFSEQSDMFYSLTNHMITVHHASVLYCLTGPKGNYQAEKRLSGFMKAVSEAGIADKAKIFYGDFWKSSAITLANKLADGEIPMPDAIVCASDIMALSLCDTLQSKGIRIPDDVKITGFDGNILALTHYPSLTTSSKTEYYLGQSAVKKLYGIITDTLIKDTPYPAELKIGESCGCLNKNDEQIKLNQLLERNWEYHRTTYEMYISSNYFIKLAEPDSFDEFIETLKGLCHLLKSWENLDLCLCTDWFKNIGNSCNFRSEGYSKQMQLVISKIYGQNDEKDGYNFNTKYLLPSLATPHSPKLIIFTPLHYNLQVLGYLATSYKSATDYRCDYYYNNWCDAIANGLMVLKNKIYARQIEKKIEEYSVKDLLSGMLNRKGFIQQAPEFLCTLKSENKTALMLLIYAENIQILSDEKNEAIMPVINAIQITQNSYELSARISSDTFAVLLPVESNMPFYETGEKWIAQFLKIIQTIYKQVKKTVLPEFIFDYSPVEVFESVTVDALLNERFNIISQKKLSVSEKNKYEQQLIQVRREIYLDPQLDWNNTDIALKMNVSCGYFQRIYKKQFNCTVKDDLLTARLNKAKKLLKETNLHVIEIAEQCGYHEPISFMRIFKKHTGMTAKDYRTAEESST